MSEFDKNFKCPKSVKMRCAGQPRSVWKMHMEAHVAYLRHKRNALKSKRTEKDDE